MPNSPALPLSHSPTLPKWGTLYALGLGPGDPELITLKARRILRSVPTLFLPTRRPEEAGYAWAIAEPHLVPGRQRLVRLPFPGDRGRVELAEQWDANCRVVLAALAGGQDGAILTEGDPLLYSTFLHIASRLRATAPDLTIEIVPGVSSITAAAAAAGQPLVAHADRLAVLPALYGTDDLRLTLERFETVVLLKVNRVLERVVATLNELGLAERAILVERCGRPEQRIIRGASDWPAAVDYLSLVIVRK